MGQPEKDWQYEYLQLILSKIERQDEKIDAVRSEIGLARREIVALQVKSGAWGFLAGLIPVTIMLIVKFVTSGESG